MKLKAKQYREFIMGCINLYGLIDSNDAFKILKTYYPDATKKEFLEDLKERNHKYTKDYSIWATSKRNVYLITFDRIDDEEIDYLIGLQNDKPFYVPQKYEQFLKAASYETFKNENKKLINGFIKFLANNHMKHNSHLADVTLSVLYEDIRDMDKIKDINPVEICLKRLNLWEYNINDDNIEEYVLHLQEMMNSIRYYANRGHTPKELIKNKPLDLNKLTMSIGPNMRKMFESGELDIKEYVDGIINSDLPFSVKKSLLDELNEIMDEIDNTAKA